MIRLGAQDGSGGVRKKPVQVLISPCALLRGHPEFADKLGDCKAPTHYQVRLPLSRGYKISRNARSCLERPGCQQSTKSTTRGEWPR
jgi:hypothetical protein